jgi:hypothetical protein
MPRQHPLRAIRKLVNEALGALDGDFEALYTGFGRALIAPEKLMRALLVQAFFSKRFERRLMERLEFDLLFRWFWVWGSTMPSGIIPSSPRTGTGFWRATLPPNSLSVWWCCRA